MSNDKMEVDTAKKNMSLSIGNECNKPSKAVDYSDSDSSDDEKMETGEQNNDADSDSSDDDEFKLAIAKKKMKDDPWNYDGHLELINMCKEMANLDELRESRNNMSKYYPLTEELWKAWLEDEINLALSAEECQKVQGLFERAVKDYICVNVWRMYIEYIIKNLNSEKSLAEARALLERAVCKAGAHVARGGILWALYCDFENSILERIKAKKIADPEEIAKQVEVCMTIFYRQLSCSLLDTERIYGVYKEWCAANESYVLPSLHENIEFVYTASIAQLEKIQPFEDALTACRGSDAKAQIFRAYLDHQLKKGAEVSHIVILYERMIANNPLDGYLWSEYIDYINNKLDGDDILDVCARAVRNCPWCSFLWQQHIFLLEKFHHPQNEIQECLEKGLAVPFTTPEDYRTLWVAYADFLRRRIRKGNDDTAKQVTAVTDVISQACQFLAERFGLNGDKDCVLLQYWARLEAIYNCKMETVRSLWNDIMTQGHARSASMWLEYASLERRYGDSKHLRRIFTRAVKAVEDFPESIAQAWANFERDEGTLLSYEFAVNTYKARVKVLEEEKAISEKEKNKYVDKSKEKALQTKKDKRKLRKLLDGILEPQQEPVEETNVDNDDDTPKNAIFLSNLPYTTFEDRITEIFSDIGEIKRVVIEKDSLYKTKGFGFVEFESPDDVAIALRKDGMMVDGRPMFVSEYIREKSSRTKFATRFSGGLEENKLFVRGLGMSTTKNSLRKFFEPYGSLQEVRLVMTREGKSRGFAYVEFASVDDACKAREELNGTKLEGHVIEVSISNPAYQEETLRRERQEKRFSDDRLPRKKESFSSSRSRFSYSPQRHSSKPPKQRKQQLRPKISFVPRVLQVPQRTDAPDKQPEHVAAKLSNADFRSMLLQGKK
ncbi:squamous cell carcinoma antigen recognized by T-cells 3-like isoform X2 [Bacillus rossius redtenbacheri]|uniref:squamous cell carcinoma antigen recognized by T-cells 3-like isoform X2 n=1 Tax=Bacillus rossius redtenbacheri TaxID=93214 RepID=UPI002FDC8D5C